MVVDACVRGAHHRGAHDCIDVVQNIIPSTTVLIESVSLINSGARLVRVANHSHGRILLASSPDAGMQEIRRHLGGVRQFAVGLVLLGLGVVLLLVRRHLG